MTQEDPLLKLKFMAYCMSQMPPDGTHAEFSDFVRYAKFQLSLDKCVLMEDSLWDKYSDEQILIEYFANLFQKNKSERDRFEAQISGGDPDLYEWFDKKIAQNRKEMEEKAAQFEDSINFKPDTLGD